MIPKSDYIIQKSKMADHTASDFRYCYNLVPIMSMVINLVSNHMFSGSRNPLRPLMTAKSDYIIQKSKMADDKATDFRYQFGH